MVALILSVFTILKDTDTLSNEIPVRPSFGKGVVRYNSASCARCPVFADMCTFQSLRPSVAAFLSRFFIAWEIKYIKPPKYLTR